MKLFLSSLFTAVLLSSPLAAVGLEPGDSVELTLKGVNAAEHEKVTGKYKVGESGTVRLPMLKNPVTAKGLNEEQFARAAEAAYKNEGIYTTPAIEVEAVKGKIADKGPDIISVGGRVKRAGDVPYRQGLTVVQAINGGGGRDEFAGRNLVLIRDGKSYCLDYSNLKHKNVVLLPNDALQVEARGAITDGWKGSEDKLKDLLK